MPIVVFFTKEKDEKISYSYPYRTTAKVGYGAEYLGTSKRKLPKVSNGGLDKYPVDNIFDEDTNNYIHSNKVDITKDNSFEFTVDLKEQFNANTMTILGASNRLYLPTTFKLYVGTNIDELILIKDVENSPITNNNVQVTFEQTTIRYYKIGVYDISATSIKYIAFRGITFSYSIFCGTVISPDDLRFNYYGDWTVESAFSTFGHKYIGNDARLEFEFTGTQFGIFSTAIGNKFEIYIDGKKLYSITHQQNSQLSYLSPELQDSTHSIIIECESIEIDSFVIR